jgi:SAM-dependent methyltransferase
VAVDYDPLLMAIGRGVLGDADGRLRWVEADLRDPAWADQLGGEPADAALSTTALHWLDTGDLALLYRQLADVIRPGGVLLNGDHAHFPPHLPTFRQVSDAIQQRQRGDAPADGTAEDWRGWWDAVAQEPALRDLYAERQRRFGPHGGDKWEPILDVHEAALRDAGFREVGLIWQHFGNGILMAVR